ncbi:MAG: 2-dehydropantoate 2-reductase [Proteobacteria bacterium]|nr:2-dehydropantoate 2-reductase [Pseudomonadota bacterium]NOG59924.1 2-dehydropantoate 2-reductase [Pseudomonadota bacterium]
MRILILGAGAAGGYLGARLIESDEEVTFLLRGERLNFIRDNGLIVYSELGNIKCRAKFITSDKLTRDFDLVILACKAYALINAVNDIKPAIDKDTRILPLLNGVSHLQYLDEFFGREAIMGGLVHLAVELDTKGRINHLNHFHRFIFGCRHPEQNTCGRILENIISKTKLEFSLSTHIQHDMWEKFIFLTTLAGATCLFRGNIGEIMQTESGKDYITGLFQECVDIATEYGHRPNDATMHDYIELLANVDSDYTSSMLRDINGGAATEANHILGEMLKRGVEKKLSVTLLGYAYSHLQVYEYQRDRLII